MYTGFLHLHSALRWVVLILLVVAAVKALISILQKSEYTGVDNKISLFLLISAHIQLLVGFALYFVSPIVKVAREDFGAAMKNADLRYWTVEHLSIMVMAIILITMGRVLSKRATADSGKHMRAFIFFTLALGIVLYGIPWAERGWF